MKLLKHKKQIFACLCGLCMLFGGGGIVASQQSNPTAVVAKADSSTEIGLDSNCYINNESSLGRFRLPFNAPICDKNAGTANAFQAGNLTDLNGLENKLLIAGKTPAEWDALDVDFSIAFRTSQQPVFSFNRTKLSALKQDFFAGTFVVSLAEDCVLNNDYGTVKAFAVYSDGFGSSTKTCATDELTLATNLEGPFLYEGVQGGLLQIKMWFGTSVIAANDVTQDTNVDVDKMEGLQHALYFHGKSLAQWALEGSLGVVTASPFPPTPARVSPPTWVCGSSCWATR